ncbi:uncharacterized protein LOC116193966 [Punica granatum]|uniref:Uncharacterized protein LOC116193966 n=1 Tax=Punica granatum TaxID=22663 RepID=A0A6P8CBW1_PUNGR|nr:uncharacterized protein LOC116193966 [Punica granatum]
MAHHLVFFLLTLIALAALVQCQAVEFHVTNNAASMLGWARFTDQIGVEYTEQKMNSSTEFMRRLLNETSIQGQKSEVSNVTLFLETLDDDIAYTNIENQQAPVGLMEGIADSVRLKAGLAPSQGKVTAGIKAKKVDELWSDYEAEYGH